MNTKNWVIAFGATTIVALSIVFWPNPVVAKSLQVEEGFEYWMNQPRENSDTESKSRLAKVYKAVMLYSADYDSDGFSMYGMHKLHSYIRGYYTGEDGRVCFQSPLAPPELMRHSKLGFISNVPLDIKDNIFGSGLSRNELYAKDPRNYPVLVDPFIDAVHGKPGEPVLLNILFTNGTVKHITASPEYHRMNFKAFRKGLDY